MVACIFSTSLWENIYYVLVLKRKLVFPIKQPPPQLSPPPSPPFSYHHHECEVFISRLLQAVGSHLRLWWRWLFSLCSYLNWKINSWPFYAPLTFEIGSFRRKKITFDSKLFESLIRIWPTCVPCVWVSCESIFGLLLNDG